jgi:hypothetical protein
MNESPLTLIAVRKRTGRFPPNAAVVISETDQPQPSSALAHLAGAQVNRSSSPLPEVRSDRDSDIIGGGLDRVTS